MRRDDGFKSRRGGLVSFAATALLMSGCVTSSSETSAQSERNNVAARQESMRAQLDQNLSTCTESVQSCAVTNFSALAGFIREKVQSKWVVPPGYGGRNVTLRVMLSGFGEVISVEATKSSGDNRVDQSAIRAVRASSPWPVPSDPRYFEFFREMVLGFDVPES